MVITSIQKIISLVGNNQIFVYRLKKKHLFVKSINTLIYLKKAMGDMISKFSLVDTSTQIYRYLLNI